MGTSFVWDRPFDAGADTRPEPASWAALVDPADAGQFAVDPLHRPPWSPADVRPLLCHGDPKVRAIAVVLAYDLNRVDLLPDLAPIAFDNAVAFLAPPLTNREGASGLLPPSAKTVGEFARAAIKAYDPFAFEQARLSPFEGTLIPTGDSVNVLRKELAAFSADRDPTLCRPALRVAMWRATGGMSRVPSDRRDRVRQVFGLLNDVPMPQRFFAALDLVQEVDSDELYEPDRLLDMARQLPRAVRMQALGASGGVYLLTHVTDLFRAADADVFLRMADEQLRDPTNRQFANSEAAVYLVAAARLRPAGADEILGRALDRLGNGEDYWSPDGAGATLAIAMAQVGGEPSLRRAVDWVFTMRPQPGSYGSGREHLMATVAAESPARARLLYERLIRDPRLDRLGPVSTSMLMEAVQGYLGRSLATADELGQPSGDEAQRNGPFKPLPAWHKALRTTVDEWSR